MIEQQLFEIGKKCHSGIIIAHIQYKLAIWKLGPLSSLNLTILALQKKIAIIFPCNKKAAALLLKNCFKTVGTISQKII